MASRIKGITIEINGDATGLDKALKGVDKQLKDTQGQLKDVERLLKLDPGNTELLAQKQKLLSNAVTETRERLDTLRNAEAQVQAQFAKGEASQAQVDALKREIIETEAALKDAERASAGFNATLTKVGGTATKVANATRGLSMAAAAALGGIAAAGIAAAKSADELLTLSQQTGISTDELQKMSYASDLVDVSVDTITGSFKKLKTAMSAGKNEFAQLGVRVTDSSGQLRDANDVFYETIAALGKVSNETQRDVLAMAIFGKSADELAGIIDDGGAALKAYGDEAERLGLIMDETTLDKLQEANDKMDKLKAQMKATLSLKAADALEALMPALEKVMEALGTVLGFIGKLNPDTLALIVTILALIAAIAPIATTIAAITKAVSALSIAFGAMNLALAPEIALIAAIAVAVGALVYEIAKNWDWIKANVIQPIQDKIQAIIDKVKAAIDFINKLVDAIKNSTAFKVVSEVVTTVTGGNLPSTAGQSAAKNAAVYGDGTAGQTINVPLYINGTEFARATYSDFESETVRMGGRLIQR